MASSKTNPDIPQKHRPLPIRWLNTGGASLRRDRARPLSRDELMATARIATGESDFGDSDFIEPLDRLVESLNNEARLNTVGRLSTRTYLLQLLKNRLWIQADRRRQLQIGEGNIERPIFILGLPRTGSTLLFELLAHDERLLVPLSSEVMYPSPPPGERRMIDRWHHAKAAASLSLVDIISPDFKRIHPVGAGRPQECIAIQTHAFRSIQFHTTNNVPSYQRWLEGADWTPAYRYHRKFLQQLDYRRPPGTWLLKAPGHMYELQALLSVYPDARFIQTHRDPLRVVGSIASHCLALRQAFSDHVDVSETAEFWSASWHRALMRTLDLRARHPDLAGRFLDVYYAELINDPIGIVRKVYDFAGVEPRTETESAMRSWLERKPAGRHGVHRYSLADFDLSPAVERRRFEEYLHAFNVTPGV